MDFIDEAKARLEEEQKTLDYELRVTLPKEIGVARAHGDLSENAEYESAKDRQSTVQARLALVQRRLSELSRLDTSAVPRDKAGLGSKVTVEDLESGEESTYTLVIPEAADAKKSMISVVAPVGRALIGKTPGDTVEVIIPRGKCDLEVKKVVTWFGDDLE